MCISSILYCFIILLLSFFDVFCVFACSVGKFNIRAEQVQALNAVIVLICVPLFDGVIYPALAKCGRKPSPLGRMMFGMIIAASAFIAAGFVDLRIASEGEGKVSILYQIPQYIIISIAEVLVSVTGLEFAYDSAPKSMKSTVTALFLLTTALGNTLGGTLFAFVKLSNANFSFMCSGLMVANLFIFFFVAAHYHRTTANLAPVGADDEDAQAAIVNAGSLDGLAAAEESSH